MAMTDVATARETLVYVKKEVAFGTLIAPAAADAVFVLGSPSHQWNRELLDDLQHRNTASEIAQLAGRYAPVSWDLETYIKPSGAAGTPPEVGDLLECALGTYTHDAAYDAYTLADTLSSFSLWIKNGHTVFAISGCTVNQLVCIVPGADFGRFKFSGQGLRKYWAGTAATEGITAAAQKNVILEAGQAKRFSVGMVIKVGTDVPDHIIASINYTTDTLTTQVNIAAQQPDASAVVGFLPATATEVGAPVFAKVGQMTKDSVNFNTLSAEFTLNNNLKYYEDGKNNSLYISEYGRPKARQVTVKAEAYFYKEHAQFFYNQFNRDKLIFICPLGSTAGSICTLYAPGLGYTAGAGVEINNPDITGDEEKVVSIEGKALASTTYNDEFSIKFT